MTMPAPSAPPVRIGPPAPSPSTAPVAPAFPASTDGTGGDSILHIQNLCFAWKRRQPLFVALNAQVRQPGIYGLFGCNGSGKSTLLKLLAGLLAPAGGQLQVLGHVPRRRQPDYMAQVYLLPEEFHLPNLSPQQLQYTQAALYPNFDPALHATYLQELQVPADRRFASMSLGQKKKAAIAFALATQTPLLLLDEPTNGLDIVSRAQFRRLMTRPEQVARTVLISTHQAHDLENILGHLWFIDQGRLVLDAPMPRLAESLCMGAAASASDLPSPDALLYQELVGAQYLWVARRQRGQPATPVQLELLYKAISLAPQALLPLLESVSASTSATFAAQQPAP